ncbi:acyltransferase [Chromobacterium sp. IIBBL 290-4]|uniref:acyltransferase family protein n=1 Tax=Chromobacterium sp. IIBBL 290-4 TaxID=2953890 RepID=UPI0020B7248C|nr:acyltransferase [Chromobacterium sp. IIBBL 290-4]UTH76585.1 acyltransferase [Chromobacterium sp. IIBBL 290-4]
MAIYLAILTLVTLFFSNKLWGFLDTPDSDSRQRASSLDGLRGYLALSVMLHHAVIARQWLNTGRWSLPPDWFYAQLGSIAVSVFFMITAYLFWGKLLSRNGRMDWKRLYIGRLYRIAPLYWIAVSCVVFIVFARSGFQINQAPNELMAELVHWYAVGLLVQHDFNGYQNVWILTAGVLWTLKYEWKFYLALMPASLLARPRLHLAASFCLLLIAAICSYSLKSDNWSYCTLFAIGMLTASLQREKLILAIPNNIASTLAALIIIFVINGSKTPYSIMQSLPLGLAFMLIANGASLFGLLSSRPAIRLGHASYGIYLLHGLTLAICFDNLLLRPLIASSNLNFWAATGLAAILVSAIAAILHILVERPMMERGRQPKQRKSQQPQAIANP